MPSGLDKYERVRKLGQGSFGSVFLVRDLADKKQYVLKEINLTAMGPQGRTDALKEVSFMASLNHPSIISYKEFFEEVPTEAVWKNPQKVGSMVSPLHLLASSCVVSETFCLGRFKHRYAAAARAETVHRHGVRRRRRLVEEHRAACGAPRSLP